jgi:hypothetical protein
MKVRNQHTGVEYDMTEEQFKKLKANELVGNGYVKVGGKQPAEVKDVQARTDAKSSAAPANGKK